MIIVGTPKEKHRGLLGHKIRVPNPAQKGQGRLPGRGEL